MGKAKIIAVFPYDGKKVAGCKVTTGEISAKANLILMREEKEIGKVKILSMKKSKQDVLNVKQGEKCGILFVPQLDFKVSDVLLSVRK